MSEPRKKKPARTEQAYDLVERMDEDADDVVRLDENGVLVDGKGRPLELEDDKPDRE